MLSKFGSHGITLVVQSAWGSLRPGENNGVKIGLLLRTLFFGGSHAYQKRIVMLLHDILFLITVSLRV